MNTFENVKYYDVNGEITWSTDDVSEVYQRLANDLLHKKIHKCTYIRSIKDRSLYNGYREITVYQSNGSKFVYIIKD